MSSTYIPQARRQQVAAQARYRCGYCLTSVYSVPIVQGTDVAEEAPDTDRR